MRSKGSQKTVVAALLAATAVAMWAVPARAQEAPPPPPAPSIDPGEIERRIEQLRPPEPDRPVPEVGAPVTAPEVEAEPPVSFVLTAVIVEGATAIDAEALSPLYEAFLARTVGRAELEEIATRLTRAYTDAGYFLSRAIVPPQSVESGVIRVRVIEGYLADVRFEGGEGQPGLLAGYAARMTAERPARLSTVERNLLLISGLPGYRVADVQAGRLDDEGAFELIIEVGYDVAEGAANLDNRGTPEVGRLQGWLSGAANSVAGWGEQVQAVFVTVPDEPEELIYGQVAYEQPVGTGGVVLGGRLSASQINAGGDLAREDTEGRTLSIAGEGRYPILLSRRQALNVRGSATYRDVREDRFSQSTIDDRLRVLRAQADYALQDDWNGTSFIALEASQGLGILNASKKGDRALSRFDADGTFTKFRLDAIRVQGIFGPVSLRAAAQGQVSLDPLLSSEEFFLGGSQFGRAYDFGEVGGEHGLAGSVELRYGRQREARVFTDYEVYAFYDIGAAWDEVPGGGHVRDSLASAGGGMRLGLLRGVQASFEIAKPLTREVESTGDDDARVFFSISAQF